MHANTIAFIVVVGFFVIVAYTCAIGAMAKILEQLNKTEDLKFLKRIAKIRAIRVIALVFAPLIMITCVIVGVVVLFAHWLPDMLIEAIPDEARVVKKL